jgi:hypothetical protein
MPDEIDFSVGTRGKFYQANATAHLPIYLDQQVQTHLADKANAKGIDLSDLVNELLKRDIDIAAAVR